MPVAHAQTLSPTLAAPSLGSLLGPHFASALLFAGVGLLFLAAALVILRRILRRERSVPTSFRNVVLLVTVPKEAAEQEQREERGGVKQTIVDDLAPAEALMKVLGGMRAQRGFGAFLFGRHDHFSFEIVADRGLISFYVVVPLYRRQFMEQQIHAQYPAAQIEEVEDYNIFRPHSVTMGTTLRLKRPYIFALQTYMGMSVDPLNALTNSLSKIGPEEGAVIQFVVRSAKASWHNWGARVAREMQQGKTLREAVGKSGLVGFLFELFHVFFPKKPKELDMPYRLSPMEQQVLQSVEQKTSKAGFDLNIRVVVSGPSHERTQLALRNIIDSFTQYTLYEYGNGFIRHDPMSLPAMLRSFIYRQFSEGKRLVLNTEELASLFHFPLPATETPNIRWLGSRKAPAPVDLPSQGIVLGRNLYRGEERPVRIQIDDRRRHVYVIGKSGTGKSVLMTNMIIQDIEQGAGVAVIDPHGDLVKAVLEHIPERRMNDVIYFNPSDMERPMGLNMLEAQTPEEKDFAVQEMVAIFYKLFPPEMIGPMFEHNMRNVMLTLMEDQSDPGTIAEIPRMFTDIGFQRYKVQKVKDPVVRAFWEKEMAKTSDFHKSEMLGYIISKVGRFVENTMMRNIIGQQKSGFDFSDVMNNQKILLVNLAKGMTGEVNSSLLGLIITSKLQMAAMRRAGLPQEQRKDFYLYIDEFQNFVTESIATILSEARKYRLNLTIAHQFITQLVQGQDTKIRDAVFGNVGTMVAFRVGVEDAETIAKEFAPVFNEYDVMNVEMYTANVKLLINNTVSKPFNMQTFPLAPGDANKARQIIENSRKRFGNDKAQVEQQILQRSRLGEPQAIQGPAMGERNL